MDKKQVKELFRKYINNECSEKELRLLEKFLESYQKEDVSHFFEEGNQTKSKSELWKNIHSEISRDKQKNRFYPLLRYAAIFVLLIAGLAYLYYGETGQENQQVLEIESNPVVLKLENGEEKELDIQGKQDVLDEDGHILANQSGTRLVYDKGKGSKIAYNEIFVPFGKKFQLDLSDGTVVHLNAGSSLRFPVVFSDGKAREVFLKGEAYFEVAKDEDKPFLVNSEEMRIEVLGTHFNMSSYRDSNTFVVLAEGSVKVHPIGNSNQAKTITPGQKASLSNQDLNIYEVDVSDYLGWMDGQLSFNNEPFTNIIEKIERKYNVQFTNEYRKLDEVRFRGKFNNESILDLLDVFKLTAGFEYTIENNSIIIKPPKK